MGWRHQRGMNQLGLAVHSHVPSTRNTIAAFPRLLHVGIALLLTILGRTGGMDDGGADDRSRP